MYKCEKCEKIVGKGKAMAIQHYEKGEDHLCFDCYNPEKEIRFRKRKALPMLYDSLTKRREELSNIKKTNNRRAIKKAEYKVKDINKRINQAKRILK